MQLVACAIKLDGRAPKPVEESSENDEMAKATNHLPASGPFLETAATFGGLLLLRNIGSKFGIKLFAALHEFLIRRINGQRDRLLGLEEIHDEGRG